MCIVFNINDPLLTKIKKISIKSSSIRFNKLPRVKIKDIKDNLKISKTIKDKKFKNSG